MVSKQKTLKIFTERFLCLLLALLISLPMFTTLTASAATTTVVEADSTDGTYAKTSGGKWYATGSKDGGRKGQSVLLYLLERNGGGAVAGTTPKAFPCSGSMLGYELHAQDKYNRYPEVTHWEGAYVPWAAAPGMTNNGGFLKNSSTYNTAAIKAWLRTPYGEGTLGIRMVQDIWGDAVATRFTNEELILVAEPIIAVQFAQKRTFNGGIGFREGIAAASLYNALVGFKAALERISDGTLPSSDLVELLDTSISSTARIMNGSLHSTEATRASLDAIIRNIKPVAENTTQYTTLGRIYAGTPKMLARYYNSLTTASDLWSKSDQGREYYRKAANAASYISTGSVVCANAGFTLWDKGSSSIRQYHPDSNLETYSIGMLAMLAFTEDGEGDYTHTYDTSCGSTPGKAPEYASSVTSTDPSLQRSYTIIKAYRTLNTLSSTYINDGVYTREDTIGKILIEDEPTYTVVDWFTTSTPTATVGLSDATRWNESKSHASIMEQGNSSLASPITLPSAQKYLYVLLECTHTSSPPTDANYTLQE